MKTLKKFTTKLLTISICIGSLAYANTNIEKLKLAYPDFIKETKNNLIIFHDNTTMIYDDKTQNKSFKEKLKNPSLKDQMSIKYISVLQKENYKPKKNEDAGRIRYMPFFQKMYGSTKNEIETNLEEIIWLEKSAKIPLLVTKVNGVSKKLQTISRELEKLPSKYHKYFDNPAGTYKFRKIAGTNRLSTHSFAISIDINVESSHYWQWDKKENKFGYKNHIPLKIVKIFEKNGFIWGGRWYHYDTMHFEYRPELLIN